MWVPWEINGHEKEEQKNIRKEDQEKKKKETNRNEEGSQIDFSVRVNIYLFTSKGSKSHLRSQIS